MDDRKNFNPEAERGALPEQEPLTGRREENGLPADVAESSQAGRTEEREKENSAADLENGAQMGQKPLIEMREEEKKSRLTPAVKKEIREWAVTIAGALIAVFLIRTFLFQVIEVLGPSMNTTLENGERMIVTIADLKLNGPQRGDVVICHYPERSEYFVKRVIGIPGDTIWMKDGETYINAEPIDEPYVANPDLRNFGPYVVPEDNYFVMGDNRKNSNDSRSDEVGFLSRDMFVGKARLVIWPLDKMRVIE